MFDAYLKLYGGSPENHETHLRWEIMEGLQEDNPYYWFGWYGFIPIVVWT